MEMVVSVIVSVPSAAAAAPRRRRPVGPTPTVSFHSIPFGWWEIS
jgi:hypothetical protein